MSEISKLKKTKELQELILSVLFHDLRGLLGTIDNISSILSNDFEKFSNVEIKELLKVMSSSTNQMNSSINSLLTWAYFKMDKLNTELEITDLNYLLDTVLNQFENYINQKLMKINFKVGNEKQIKANEVLLYIAFQSIIHNAIKYSNLKSVIDIKINKIRKNFVVSIADNGVGISKANMKRLFHIPCQMRTSGTNGESGFGLGLAIAKDFIEACGGSINIQSGLKKGTVVEIVLQMV